MWESTKHADIITYHFSYEIVIPPATPQVGHSPLNNNSKQS